MSGRMCVSSGCQVQASLDCASYVSWNNGFSGMCFVLYNGIIMIAILAVVIFKCVHAYHYVEHSKILHSVHRMHLSVLCGFLNKLQLDPYTASYSKKKEG